MSTATNDTEQKRLCQNSPDDWDLDKGDASRWRRAITTCWACPLLELCAAERDAYYPGVTGPRGVVWAGRAYNDRGEQLTLRQLHRRAAADSPAAPHRKAS